MQAVEKINFKIKKQKEEEHNNEVETAYMNRYDKHQLQRKQAITRLIYTAWMARKANSVSGKKLKSFAAAHFRRVQDKAAAAAAAAASERRRSMTMVAEERRKEAVVWKQISEDCGMDEVARHVPPFCIDPTIDLNEEEARGYKPLAAKYFRFSKRCDAVARDPVFQTFITVCILIAMVLVGVMVTYEKGDTATPAGVIVIDHIISAIFLSELVIKVIAENFYPWRYFYGGIDTQWNRLDFVVVVASYSPLGSMALLLRMLRLLKVLKMIKVVPQMRMLVLTLLSSTESLAYTCILLFMCTFMCAIVCVMTFGENDPAHFDNLHLAMMTLFQIATGDAWTSIMYTAQYGCDKFPSDLGECENPHAFGWFAVIFFSALYTMGGLVFMNLFIGVITAGMASAMDDIAEDELADRRVQMLQELPNGEDLSVRVCASLGAAFNMLDTDGTNRLMATDVQYLFYLMDLFPSRMQVNSLLARTCEALAKLEGNEYDPSDEDCFVDRGE
jgi:voltage-gated sodium channel